MPKQLNIRSDEAYELAQKAARRLGTTKTEAVIRALRRYAEPDGLPTYDDLTPEQKADYARFRGLARRARAEATNPDYSADDLYDEHGLPK